MEIIENKEKGSKVTSVMLASLLLLGGLALMVYFMTLVPHSSGITIWTFLLCCIAVYVPVIAGGTWLNTLQRQAYEAGNARYKGVMAAVFLILLGLIMLGFSSGLFLHEWKRVFLSWQMLLVFVGVLQLCKQDSVAGLTMLFAGTFFIVPRIIRVSPASWNINTDFISAYWPMLLIALGIALLLSALIRPDRRCGKRSSCSGHGNKMNAAKGGDGYVDFSLVFTGAEHVVLEPEFGGGNISTVFGGMNLDLRRTNLPEGTTYLYVSSVFGGVDVLAPDTWVIEIKNESIFGGFSDKRMPVKEIEYDGRKLVIVARCVFGGGEVK